MERKKKIFAALIGVTAFAVCTVIVLCSYSLFEEERAISLRPDRPDRPVSDAFTGFNAPSSDMALRTNLGIEIPQQVGDPPAKIESGTLYLWAKYLPSGQGKVYLLHNGNHWGIEQFPGIEDSLTDSSDWYSMPMETFSARVPLGWSRIHTGEYMCGQRFSYARASNSMTWAQFTHISNPCVEAGQPCTIYSPTGDASLMILYRPNECQAVNVPRDEDLSRNVEPRQPVSIGRNGNQNDNDPLVRVKDSNVYVNAQYLAGSSQNNVYILHHGNTWGMFQEPKPEEKIKLKNGWYIISQRVIEVNIPLMWNPTSSGTNICGRRFTIGEFKEKGNITWSRYDTVESQYKIINETGDASLIIPSDPSACQGH